MKERFLRLLFLYLSILITLQTLGVLYFLWKPSIYGAILLTVFLGTILPLLLALIFMKLVKLT